MNKTVIVTGAAGFIGSHLVDRLLDLGYYVIGVDNFVRGTRKNVDHLVGHARFQMVEVDLADDTALRSVYRSCLYGRTIEAIWHLAANSDISKGSEDPSVDLRDTFMTTFNVLRLMEECSVKNIVFSSTSAIYGTLLGKISENAGPLLPVSNYGAMKLASEGSISSFVEKWGGRSWICRFPNVVGSRATHGVIYDFFHKMKKDSRKLVVLGDGSQCKPYLHVSDLVDALLLIWNNTHGERNCFNIGQKSSATTVKYIAERMVQRAGGEVSIEYGRENKGWVGDVPHFEYDTEKINQLGWFPSLDSNASVDRAIEEIFSQGG